MDKKAILSALRRDGEYVSGQQLCDSLGVSRTAVWKAVNQLKEEGYEIEALQNRGYRIIASPDVITAQEVESRLNTRWAGHPTVSFEQIDSTNNWCKKAAEEGAQEGLLVLADEQTAGKGRRGRRWETPRGSAVAMTLLLRPQIRPDRISMVTLIEGMALTDACRRLYQLPIGIKWPNDVVIHGKKISGTLTEMSAEMSAVNYVVVGTGINVNVESFPEELADTATSIMLETGARQSRAELIAASVDSFERYYEKFLQTQDLSLLKEEYDGMLLNRGRQVRVLEPGNEYDGVAEGIDTLGELLVRTEDGSVRKVYAGEVSVRGIYGYV